MFVAFFTRGSMRVSHFLVGIILCVSVLLPSIANAADDEVHELIDEGEAAYEKGDFTLAAASLQQALNLIAELSVQSYMALLPNAPEGWEVEEKSADESALFSGVAGLIVATKRYRQKEESTNSDGATKKTAQTMQIALISNLPSFAQMAVNALAQLRGAKQGADLIVVAGYQGTVNCDKQMKCEVMLQLGEKAIVTAESQNIPKETLLASIRQIKLDRFAASIRK